MCHNSISMHVVCELYNLTTWIIWSQHSSDRYSPKQPCNTLSAEQSDN